MEGQSLRSKLVTRSTRNTSLTCHPAALPAWRCWQTIQFQAEAQELQTQLLQLIQAADPLWVVRKPDSAPSTYQFFGGFPFASVIQSRQISHANFVIVDQISDAEIQRLAWGNILKCLANTLDRATGLDSLYKAVNEFVPPELNRELFGRRKISKNRLATISRTTISTIRCQEAKVDKQTQSSESTIFSKVREKA